MVLGVLLKGKNQFNRTKRTFSVVHRLLVVFFSPHLPVKLNILVAAGGFLVAVGELFNTLAYGGF